MGAPDPWVHTYRQIQKQEKSNNTGKFISMAGGIFYLRYSQAI